MKNFLFFLIFTSYYTISSQTSTKNSSNTLLIEKTNAEWKLQLSPSEYDIIRNKGTERAFSGEYWDTHIDGIYHCKACGLPLFNSVTKFESGTGWPSFFDEISGNIAKTTDKSNGWTRTEITCVRCDGHLGHIFNDGPQPTGLRYCVNSTSLKLKPTPQSD